ncbi:MAG: nucleotidyltransferase domain-containing protein [Candidatus Heimdallarchaeota archaeon]|nr:nucleotidyltransferase domain-containing protein [Candidatus Heimdallarchaeota archaeon]
MKKACLELLPDAEVYLFGSALHGELVAGSDIDILIVTKKESITHKERARIVIGIEDIIGLPFVHPFEFHVMTKTEYQRFRITTNAPVKEI